MIKKDGKMAITADNERYIDRGHVLEAMDLAKSQERDPFTEQKAIAEGETYHYLGRLSWLMQRGLVGSHVLDVIVRGVGIVDSDQSGKVVREFLHGGEFIWSTWTYRQIELAYLVRSAEEVARK